MEHFLSIPEEVLLLKVSETGGIIPGTKRFDVILAASVLMDLALQNRLDSDLENLIPVNDNPTGNIVLDEALQMVNSTSELHKPSYWISQIAIRSGEFAEYLIADLALKKVLKIENQKVLWFFSKRKYPVIKDKEIKEVRERVRDIVFSDDIPEIRDVVIISILHYGGLHSLAFSESEISQHRIRIEQLAKMDLIGQAISGALSELVTTPFASLAKSIKSAKTPEEKLELLVQEMKEKFRISEDSDLPSWLRKGTEQYGKTLAFIQESGTADIYYHHIKDKYFVKSYGYHSHIFGSGA